MKQLIEKTEDILNNFVREVGKEQVRTSGLDYMKEYLEVYNENPVTVFDGSDQPIVLPMYKIGRRGKWAFYKTIFRVLVNPQGDPYIFMEKTDTESLKLASELQKRLREIKEQS